MMANLFPVVFLMKHVDSKSIKSLQRSKQQTPYSPRRPSPPDVDACKRTWRPVEIEDRFETLLTPYSLKVLGPDAQGTTLPPVVGRVTVPRIYGPHYDDDYQSPHVGYHQRCRQSFDPGR